MHAVHPIWFTPFVALLLAIALMPFIAPHWWERHYPKVSIALGLISLGYYASQVGDMERIGHTAAEYAGFIALVGSLFVISGGILIQIKGEATPTENVVFLGFGALLSNVIGTAGASMLLIRPYIRMNRHRISAYHIVFFIFIVSNVGGCLTPIGDPPLFLGYLKGIPFFWVAEHLWVIWLIGVGWLLAVFFAFETWQYLEASKKVRDIAAPANEWKVKGLRNLAFLGIVLAAVFISKPVFVRELLMIGAAAGSYLLTRKIQPEIHRENEFNFRPLREVAWLFAGIFATMIPMLDWLEHNSAELGIRSAGAFYWGTGGLSSVLDNAPTYLNFLSAAVGLLVDPEHVQAIQQWIAGGMTATLAGQPAEVTNTVEALKRHHGDLLEAGSVPLYDIQICYLLGNVKYNAYIIAISVGAVFFGAMTYIGNAPNFMVKSIAEHHKLQVPSFFGYVLKFAIPILMPLLLIIWWFFFR